MVDLTLPQHRSHPRTFDDNRFCYPVLSRRSKGLSLGVNLNPDKICNFDCVYCQVDRSEEAEPETTFVETDRLYREMESLLEEIQSGQIWQHPQFASVPPELRRLNDIAFSGDGEPTSYKNFDEIMTRTAALKRKHELKPVKMVLITNASLFHRPVVQRGMAILDENQGEVWAKLDAGTEEYFQKIERTRIPFQQVLDNLLLAAHVRPLVIQSLFLRFEGQPPSEAEISAYCDRLNTIKQHGGRLKLVQIYTIARPPAESFVGSLTNAEVDAIVETTRRRTGLTVEGYYGST
jgi:wyosine [tRNA(Phe)-imidazoG37] synthetase (radical SAM superfamily)